MKPAFLMSFALLILLLPCMLMAQPADRLHKNWDKILQTYVDRGAVDYSALKKNSADMIKLDAYLSALANTDTRTLSTNDQLAFWINAYNAFTLKLILNYYPLKSIRDISNPWKNKIWLVNGELHSLDQIEHEILRKQFKEPRIHFAIVCASKGCPDLFSRAYLPADIQLSLDKASRHFFNQKKNFRIEKSGTQATVYLSKLFKWFRDDFGQNDREILDYIKPYLSIGDLIRLNGSLKQKIKYIDYDWSLNE